MRKPACHRFVIVAAALLLSACAIFNGPRTVMVPTEQLQASLERQFPVDMRYLELFDLHVSNPRLRLEAATGRAVLDMDVVIAPPFVQRTWKGSITLSGPLRMDDLRHALVMGEPRLEAFQIEGFDPQMSRQITRYGGLFAEQVLQKLPIASYEQLRPEYASANLVPTKIDTRPDGLVITFEPAH